MIHIKSSYSHAIGCTKAIPVFTYPTYYLLMILLCPSAIAVLPNSLLFNFA